MLRYVTTPTYVTIPSCPLTGIKKWVAFCSGDCSLLIGPYSTCSSEIIYRNVSLEFLDFLKATSRVWSSSLPHTLATITLLTLFGQQGPLFFLFSQCLSIIIIDPYLLHYEKARTKTTTHCPDCNGEAKTIILTWRAWIVDLTDIGFWWIHTCHHATKEAMLRQAL